MKMSIFRVLAQKLSNIRSLLDRPHMPSPRSRQALSVVKNSAKAILTLVNVFVDLVVFTRIAVTSQTGSGRYWC